MEICREQERMGLWKQAACDKLGYCAYAIYLTAHQATSELQFMCMHALNSRCSLHDLRIKILPLSSHETIADMLWVHHVVFQGILISEGLRYLCHIICMLNKKQFHSHYHIFCVCVYGNYWSARHNGKMNCFPLQFFSWKLITAMLNIARKTWACNEHCLLRWRWPDKTFRVK